MDPFSVALGVLQVTGTALKISSLIYQKVKIFRNYSREVKRVLKGVDRQRQNFIHEIHLFLRQAQQNEDNIEQMLDDTEHPLWKDDELQLGLDAAFGKSLGTCRDIIEEIGSILRSLQAELSCFDGIGETCTKDESLKEAVRRLRQKVKITFDKSKFEEQIKSLRELNDDLRRSRGQAADIKESSAPSAVAPTSRPLQQLNQEYGSIGKIRRASKALHQALAAAWVRSLNESSLGDVRHNVKLFVNAQSVDEVQMEVVISCYGHQQPRFNLDRYSPGIVRLHVASQIVDFMESGFSTPPASNSDADSGRCKRRKVHFEDDDAQEDQGSSETIGDTPKLVDLRNVVDICTVFNHKNIMCGASKCLGYLDGFANETFRHSFFEAPLTRGSSSPSVKMSEILNQPIETSVNFVDQLKLARSFVMAVLRFHSTPWLREHYSLQDLSFYHYSDGDVPSCLQTAHLSLDFVQHSPDEDCTIQMDDVNDAESFELARLTHGIRNLTLWCLGAVLLQIGTWSTIERLDDVVNVRRMAQRVPMLGKRYRDLTKQCLDCDFAFGDDLSKPRLQQAVYENVVCRLTEMISSLDIEND